MISKLKTKKLLSLAINLACVTTLSVSAVAQKKGRENPNDCKKCPLAQAGKKASPLETKKCASHKKQCKFHQADGTDEKHTERKTLPPKAQKFVERMRDFHQEIGQLYRDGKRDEAREVTQQLRDFVQNHAELARQARPTMRGQHPAHHPSRITHGDPAQDKAQDSQRRLELLAQAAENLEQAGLPKEAKQIRQQSEKIKRELQASSHHSCPHGQQLTKEVQKLRKTLDQIKKEIAALKKKQHKEKH